MGISDYVSMTITLSGAASVTRQGFGTPCLMAYHTRYTDRFRLYPSASALTQLVAEGFSTTGHVYRAMSIACSQSPCPPNIGLGRRALPFTQVLKLKCVSATAGDAYAVTLYGKDGVAHAFAYTSTGVPNTDAAAIAALMVGTANAGTVTVATDTITITQTTAGSLNDLRDWTQNLQVSDTTADPGITADINAVLTAAGQSWYGLALDSNSPLEVAAAAAFTESTGQGGKFGFFTAADNACVNGGLSSDVFSAMETLSYLRSHTEYSGRAVVSNAGIANACILGAQAAGSTSLAYKSPAGVPCDNDQTLTETQQLVLNTISTGQPGTGGKNGNYYKTISGFNATFPGVTPKGQWVHFIIGIDWLKVNIQADVFGVIAGEPGKLGFTDISLIKIGDAIKTRLKIGAAPPYNIIDGAQPITVNAPTVAGMTPADKAAGNAPGFSFGAIFQGGIVTAALQGTVSP